MQIPAPNSHLAATSFPLRGPGASFGRRGTPYHRDCGQRQFSNSVAGPEQSSEPHRDRAGHHREINNQEHKQQNRHRASFPSLPPACGSTGSFCFSFTPKRGPPPLMQRKLRAILVLTNEKYCRLLSN
jgi:hypothetical protein